jgi:hypothetical protein
LGYSELIWWLCWRRRVWAERRILKDKKRIQGLLGFCCWVFRIGTWATKDTLLFSVYERIDSESPNIFLAFLYFLQIQNDLERLLELLSKGCFPMGKCSRLHLSKCGS